MDIQQLANLILEFYSSTDPARRDIVCQKLEESTNYPEWWRVAIAMANSDFPPQVQFYGLIKLNEAVTYNCSKIVESEDDTERVRAFYYDRLRVFGATMPHAVFNAISSGLASFIIHTYPDIWPEAFEECAAEWSSLPEVLFRVISDVTTRYVKAPITTNQKRLLQSKLSAIVPDVTARMRSVLVDPTASDRSREMLVECLEGLLLLPGAKITDCIFILTCVFEQAEQSMWEFICKWIWTGFNLENPRPSHKMFREVLSRLLTVIQANDELCKSPTLVVQFTERIVDKWMPRLVNEITMRSRTTDEDTRSMITLEPILTSLAEYMRVFVREIIHAVMSTMDGDDQRPIQMYINMCNFFLAVSNVGGHFPRDETISDIPEQFWTALCEELTECAEDDHVMQSRRQRLRFESSGLLMEVLRCAVEKIAYEPAVYHGYSAEEQEIFFDYRRNRSDIAMSVMSVEPFHSLHLLLELLDQFLAGCDPYGTEAVMFHLESASDAFTESSSGKILASLLKCGVVRDWQCPADAKQRFIVVLMKYIEDIAQFIITSTSEPELLAIVTMISDLMFSVSGTEKAGLDTLTSMLKGCEDMSKNALMKIMNDCYQLSTQEDRPVAVRLSAIQCVSIALSHFDHGYIMNSLDEFLKPRLEFLKTALSGAIDMDPRLKDERILFEMDAIRSVVGTLESHGANDAPLSDAQITPVRAIMDGFLTMFDVVLAMQNAMRNANFTQRLCDILFAGVLSLYVNVKPFLATYLNYIDVLLFYAPEHCSNVVKQLFTTFRSPVSSVGLQLFHRLAQWLREWRRIDNEEWDCIFADMTLHICRKSWPAFLKMAKLSDCKRYMDEVIQSIAFGNCQVIRRSRDPKAIRNGYDCLACLIKNCAASDDQLLKDNLFAICANSFVTAYWGVFQTWNLSCKRVIAQIIHKLHEVHGRSVRSFLQNLPFGTTPLATAILLNPTTMNNIENRVGALMTQASERRHVGVTDDMAIWPKVNYNKPNSL